MALGVGNIVALICIVISIIFAICDPSSHQRSVVGIARYLCGLVVGRTRSVGWILAVSPWKKRPRAFVLTSPP